MRNSNDCLREAERCERDSAITRDSALRMTLREVAATWRELARSGEARHRLVIRLMEIVVARETQRVK